MFNWLWNTIYGSGRRIANNILNLIHEVVNGLMGALGAIYGALWAAWWDMLWAASALVGIVEWFCRPVMYAIWSINREITDFIYPIMAGLRRRITDGLAKLETTVAGWVKDAITTATNAVNGLLSWVVRNVYTPVKAWVDDLYRKMSAWAWTAYYYITHPDALARVIFWALWAVFQQNAWAVAEITGEWLLRLVLANFVRSVRLVETIVADVL